MKLPVKIGFSAMVMATLFGFSATSYADKDRHGGNFGHGHDHGYILPPPAIPPVASGTATNLTVSLVAQTGYTGYTGSVRYGYNTNGGLLKASINVPVDGVNITTALAASNSYTLQINDTSNITPIATCTLFVSNIDFTYSGSTLTEVAEYTAAVSQVGTAAATASVGNCVSSTDTSGLTTLPVLAAGNVVTVSIAGVNVLTGPLVATTGRR